jgi:small conductance mechanosensitive channel
VAYDTDMGAALRTVEEVLRANARVLQDPRPVIGVSRLAESQVRIAVKPWVNVPDFAPAGAEVTRAILEAFRQGNIVIPFPQREVRMKTA